MSLNPPQDVTAAPDVLNSWKEIACYLDRGVRTVQRWEAELGMPVRRPRGKSRSAVLAMRSELDLWLKGCPQGRGEQMPRAEDPGSKTGRSGEPKELIARTRSLCAELSLHYMEFDGELHRLMGNLERMQAARQTQPGGVRDGSLADFTSHQRSHASSH